MLDDKELFCHVAALPNAWTAAFMGSSLKNPPSPPFSKGGMGGFFQADRGLA